MMNNYGLRLAAFAEQMSAICAHYWAVFIRRMLLPLFLWRGRDMVLLRNGQWVDASPEFAAADVQWQYDSIAHRIVRPATATAPVARWKWLAATSMQNGRDMSDFFSDLRISRGEPLADTKVVELFIHQKGWNPGMSLRVVNRMSAEEEIVSLGEVRAASAADAAATGHRELDYIR
jgi:hypothetical protein